MAPCYRLWGEVFRADRPLPELDEVEPVGTPCRLELLEGRGPGPSTVGEGQLSEWDVSAEPIEGGIRLVFRGLASFEVLDDASAIRVAPVGDLPEETLGHLLLDQAIPRALAHWGHLVVHASAVVLPAGAVAFFGLSGQGKSTLAAAFGVQGFTVLADDGIRVEERGERLFAHGSYPGLRLWGDAAEALLPDDAEGPAVAHYTHKLRVEGDLAYDGSAVPLLRCYHVGDRLDAGTEPPVVMGDVNRAEAFLRLMESLFTLDERPDAVRRDVDRLAESPLLDTVRSLRVAPGREHLPAVVASILEDVTAGG